MKKILLMCLIGLTWSSMAQDVKDYSDEELSTYAKVMVWAEAEKERMTDVYNGWINNDAVLEATRFVKIRDAQGDSLTLTSLEVTDDELMAFEKIQANYDSMTTAFKEVYIDKIKTDIGAGLYNTLKKDLKTDATLKGRYKVIFTGLESEEGTVEEEDTDE